MTLQIVKVESRRDLKRFVTLPIELLSRYDAFVPPLIREDMELFDPKKNPAFETSEAALFLALQDGRPVGRIAAVLSHGANNKYKE
ncbi:MAG TPA: N-acetyltransferase, partial [Candidatus Aminicenantes bacterium]|nr:N-acetyltransferase [Candidatus Aminicenantes bacterium]